MIIKKIIAFLQIRISSMFKEIRLYDENLYIDKKRIPKFIINNETINRRIKKIELYEPEYETLKNLVAFKNLEELCIRFFKFESLPEEIWNLKTLISLELEQCEISDISGNIKNLNNLEELKISCKIVTLTPEISKLKNLKTLNLSGSYLLKKITKLPESLNSLIFLL